MCVFLFFSLSFSYFQQHDRTRWILKVTLFTNYHCEHSYTLNNYVKSGWFYGIFRFCKNDRSFREILSCLFLCDAMILNNVEFFSSVLARSPLNGMGNLDAWLLRTHFLITLLLLSKFRNVFCWKSWCFVSWEYQLVLLSAVCSYICV